MSRALRDLDDIEAYIAKTLQEPETALRMVEELEAQILPLETVPYRLRGRWTGAYAGKDYRQLFVKNYAVIFRITTKKEKQVIIVTVDIPESILMLPKCNGPSGLVQLLAGILFRFRERSGVQHNLRRRGSGACRNGEHFLCRCRRCLRQFKATGVDHAQRRFGVGGAVVP